MAQIIKISVIIATKDEEVNLARLLVSLKQQTVHNFEIIIVDNYSTDATVKVAYQFTSKVFIIGGERSAQRNFGARKALGNYLLFLDADMQLIPNILAECLNTIKSDSFAGLIIPETIPGKKFFVKIKRLEKKLYQGELTMEAPRFFTKRAFFAVGGYNNSLVAGEDWDLSQRIGNRGKIGRIDSKLFHYEDSLFREIKHKIYYAQFMQRYSKIHMQDFKNQSGMYRIRLLIRKHEVLRKDFISAVGLVFLKIFEYGIFRYVQLTKKAN